MKHDERHHRRLSPEVDAAVPTPEELRFAERYAETVDAYVAGRLDEAARREVERAARSDARLREALDDARFAASFFARAPVPRADRTLDARILAAIDAEAHATAAGAAARSRAPRDRRRALRGWGAVAAVAATVLLMINILAPRWFGAQEPDARVYVAADGSVFTEAEVRAAAQQMGLAMAVFGRTMDRTTRAVQSDLTGELREHVREPLREGLGRGVNSIPYLRPRGGEQEHSGNIPEPPAGERPLRSRALEGALIGERT